MNGNQAPNQVSGQVNSDGPNPWEGLRRVMPSNYHAGFAGDAAKVQPEEAKADAETKLHLEEARVDAEAKARLEAEARARLEAETRAKNALEDVARPKALATNEAASTELASTNTAPADTASTETAPTDAAASEAAPAKEHPIDLSRFFAVRANYADDLRAAARDHAERLVTTEASKNTRFLSFKRIWRGTLAKKYYERKYTREILSGEREIKGDDGEYHSLEEIFAKNQASSLERFRRGIADELDSGKNDSDYIHRKFGETYEVDEATSDKVRGAIKDFVNDYQKLYQDYRSGESHDAESAKALNHKLNLGFKECLERHEAFATDNGEKFDKRAYKEYADVAMEALKLSNHAAGIDNVIAGFKVYEAKIKDGARTEAHRSSLTKLLDYLDDRTSVPPLVLDAVAAASGVAMALTKGAARGALGAFGFLAPAVFSASKEYHRITDDRTRMLRDAELGITYKHRDSETQPDLKGLKYLEKKRAKYEAKLGGTLYEIKRAEDLISALKKATSAKESEGKSQSILDALAEARVRIDYSDSEKKGLIAYTAGKAGDERLALDIAVIEAEKALSSEDRKSYEVIKNQHLAELTEEVASQDKSFSKIRAFAAIKKAGRTLAVGGASFLVTQEAIAAISPDQIGIFEKAGLLKTENKLEASETLLARLGGVGNYTIHTAESHTLRVSGDDQTTMKYLESQGYAKVKLRDTETHWREVASTESTSPAGSAFDRAVKYDGWANNGTRLADGNETRLFLKDGQFTSGMFGHSTAGGDTLNYDDLVRANRIKGYLTIGGAKLEVVASTNATGQLTWGENGVFNIIAPDGTSSTIRAIGDNGEKLYKYFEVAVDNGSPDGIQHLIPLATDTGNDNFTGLIESATQNYELVETPALYQFTKLIPHNYTFDRTLDTTGIVSLGAVNDMLMGRVNLGAARAEAPTANPVETPPTPGSSATPEASESQGAPEAPETTPEASPEPTEAASTSVTNSTTEAASSTAPEAVPAETLAHISNYRNAIEARRPLIGEDIYNALTRTDLVLDEATINQFDDALGSLSPEGRAALGEIVRDAYDANITTLDKRYFNLGAAFRSHARAKLS